MRLSGTRRSLHLAAGMAGCLLMAAVFSLTGCQSTQQQRIEEAKDLIRQRQALDTQYGKPGANTPASPSASPSQPADPSKPDKSLPANSVGLPIYPGATIKTHMDNTGDGIAMQLLETNDRIDLVLAYYQEQMKAGARRVAPTITEEKRDGMRVVRFSVPRDDGGLQTVEISEETGKTGIQLMNVSPGTSGGPVIRAPGASGPPALPPPPTGSGSTTPLPPPP